MVGHDQLEVGERLGEDGADRLLDVGLVLVRRHHHRHAWRCSAHVRTLPHETPVNIVGRVPADLAPPGDEHLVSVVIPIYQGERHLPRVLAELAPLAPAQRLARRHAVPGGRGAARPRLRPGRLGPASSASSEQAHDFVRPIWLSRNFGQHAATLAGMASSGGDWIVTLDEDGQHDPADIGAMLDVALAEQATVVYARPTNAPPHGAVRNLASRGAKRVGQRAERRRGRLGVPQLPADPRRGRAQRRGVRRRRGLPRRRAGLGRRPAATARSSCATRARTADSGYSMRTLLSHFWRMVLTGGTRGLRLVSVPRDRVRAARAACSRSFSSIRQLVHPAPVPAGPRSWSSLLICTGRDPVLARRDRRVRRRRGQHGDGQAALPDHPGPRGRTAWPATAALTPARTAWVVGGGGLLGSAVCRRLRALGRRSRTSRRPVGATTTPRSRRWSGQARAAGRRAGRSAGAPARAWSRPAEEELDGRGGGPRGVPRAAGSPVGAGRRGSLPRLVGRWGVRRGQRRAVHRAHRAGADLGVRPRQAARSEAARHRVRGRAPARPLLVGRISNLYGPGQNLAKPQGLVSQLCRAQLTRQPLSVYVSLDTMRDYLYVDDAAAMVVAATRRR